MSPIRRLLTLALSTAALSALAAPVTVTVSRQDTAARDGEMIRCDWSAVSAGLPGVEPDHLLVRDAAGKSIAYQFTNLTPNEKAGTFHDVLFQANFAKGQKELVFTIEAADAPQGPFPAKVFARYVPERLDDFAWENDRMGHRIYGAALNTDAAAESKMRSGGIDFWAKRVDYLIVDRWYLRGHDHYHKDQGEGLDFYSVGTGCGVGGTGIWDGKKLADSGNWANWQVLANGPLRAIFQLGYNPIQVDGKQVKETRRFTVDASRNVDQIEATFQFEGGGEQLVAIGLSKHKNAKGRITKDQENGALILWEDYEKKVEGGLGTAVLLPPGKCAGFAEDELNYFILVKARSGEPVRYWAGGGWSRSLQSFDAAKWTELIQDYARRLRDPLAIQIKSAP